MGRKTHGPYLVAAIEFNDLDKVSEVLAKNFRDRKQIKELLVSEVPRLANEYTEVPLLLAASLPDPAILKYLVLRHEANINHIHEHGFVRRRKLKTCLIVAVRLGLYDTVDAILSMNGDPNIADHKGRRALHHAVRRSDYRMAKLLLARGAQANDADMLNNTPLHVATIYGHTELVKLLLHHGADVYKKGQHSAIAIHMAAREGHANLVRLFCQHEVNANVKVPCYDNKDKAPIHVASERGHAETVFALLECCNASADIKDSEGETPIHCCVISEYDALGMKSKEDYVETVKVLLNHGANVNLCNARGETALHLAARNEFQKVIEVLVLAGCDPMINDNDRHKAIDLVSDDDAVSKQMLKSAMEDRERIMNDAFEVRAKGFVTSVQPQLPLTIRSPSIFGNGQLVNSFQSIHNQSHSSSMPGMFAPRMSPMSFQDDAYLNPLQSFNPFTTVNQSSSLSGGSITNSIPSPIYPFPVSGSEELHSEAEKASLSSRSNRSSQSSAKKSHGHSNKRPPKHGNESGRSKMSETSSLWEVTPNASLSNIYSDNTAMGVLPKNNRTEHNATEGNVSNPKKYDTKMSKKGLKFIPVNKAYIQDGTISPSTQELSDDDTLLDSFETTSESWQDDTSQIVARPSASANTKTHRRKNGVTEWVEEQVEMRSKTRKGRGREYESESGASTSDVFPPTLPPPRIRHPSNSSSDTSRHRVPPPVPAKSVKNKKDKKNLTKDSNSERVIEVQIDDTQVPGHTIVQVTPIKPPGPARTEVLSSRDALKAISQLDDDSFIDMLSQSDFSFSDTMSEISDLTDGETSTISLTGKNCKKFVFMEQRNRTKGSRKWEKMVTESSKTDQKETRDLQMNRLRNGETKHKAQKSGKVQQQEILNSKSSKAQFNGRTDTSRNHVQHNSSESYSESSDDDTVVSARQVSKPGKITSQNIREHPKKAQQSPAPNSILKTSPLQNPTSPTFLFPTQSQLVKQPVSNQPMLVFQRPNSVALAGNDPVSKDYLFHKAMSGINSASAEDILEQIGQKTAHQNLVGNQVIGNHMMNLSMASDLSPGSENRLSGSSFGGTDCSGVLMMNPYQQNALGLVQLQSINVPDAMQMELKRQRDFQIQQQEYRRQEELQIQQFQQQRLELMRYQEMQRLQALQEQEMLQQRKEEHKTRQPRKRTKEASDSGPLPNQLYEELPDANSENRTSVGSEEYFPSDDSSSSRNIRTLKFPGGGKLGYTLRGGNNVGVFVGAVENESVAKRGGLEVGDQILKVNGRVTKGMTKEAVMQMIINNLGTLHLAVEFNSMKFNSIMSSNKPGDYFHVIARFNNSTTDKDELAVREGDIFMIVDTCPDDHHGSWLAKKVKSSNTSEVDQVGLIPNQQSAELLLVKKDLTDNKNADKRGNSFMRSFRRSKSVEREPKGKDSQPTSPAANIVTYEHVVQVIDEMKRPVVIMGLFCATVRDMLVRDSPGIFEIPAAEVERKNDLEGGNVSDTTPLVNERLIQAIQNKDKHCLMIVSPKAVEYLREKTALNPIAIYMSPVSKSVVKVLRAKFEPNVNRKPGFMLEEATKFEKAYTSLFNAIVPYKTDATWFSLLKDTIDRIQKLPKWELVKPDTTSESGERDSPDIVRTTKRNSRKIDAENCRTSKSTDDIPDQIQDLLNRHASKQQKNHISGSLKYPDSNQNLEGAPKSSILRNKKNHQHQNGSVGQTALKLAGGNRNNVTWRRNLLDNVETPL